MTGILLSKSFGRQRYEIGRFRGENERLTGLQIRQTMIGRSFFAVVGTFFSITPALVYLVAGWQLSRNPAADLRRHDRGVHHAAVAAVLPDRLDAAGLHGGAVLHGAVRPDLRVPRHAAGDQGRTGRRHARSRATWRVACGSGTSGSGTTSPPRRRRCACRGGRRHPTSTSAASGRWTAWTSTIEPGQLAALVGPSGAGKTTITYLVPRLYDVQEGSVRDRRARRAEDRAGVARRHHRRRHAGDLPVPHHDPAQPPVRASRRHAGGAGGRRARGQHPRPDRGAARGLRHDGGGARLQAVRRREAAARDRPRDPEGSADPDPGRGDVVAGHARPSGWCRRRWSRSCTAARRSRSRTGCPRSCRPT